MNSETLKRHTLKEPFCLVVVASGTFSQTGPTDRNVPTRLTTSLTQKSTDRFLLHFSCLSPFRSGKVSPLTGPRSLLQGKEGGVWSTHTGLRTLQGADTHLKSHIKRQARTRVLPSKVPDVESNPSRASFGLSLAHGGAYKQNCMVSVLSLGIWKS